MYLLVFITLIVSLIGIYTQVLGLQTARMFAGQMGLAQAMMSWHAAAVSMAGSIIQTNPAGYAPVATVGCSLTAYLPPGGTINFCPPPLKGGLAVDTNGTISDTTPTLSLLNNHRTGLNECVHLPNVCTASDAANNCTACTSLYNLGKYQFYSILFQDASTKNYVITFIQNAPTSLANPSGLLTLANAVQTGFSGSDLLQQLRHTKLPSFSYGSIVTGTPYTLVATGSQYNLPATFTAITNASQGIGIIGAPDGF